MTGEREAPLSPAQLAIWMHEQVSAEPTLYVEHACYEILGDLDEDAFAHTVERALAAHPAFSAAVHARGALPRMELGVHPVTVERRTVNADELAATLRRESLSGPSLAEGQLSRCLLLTVGPGRRVLLVVWHHLVADGASLRVFLRTLQDLWSGAPPREAGDGLTVCDVALEQRAAASAATDRAREVAERVAGLPVRALPPLEEGPGQSRCVVWDEPTGAIEGLARAATAARVTVPMLLNAAFQRAVGQVWGLGEFLLGCVAEGRSVPGSRDLVGCFVNTILLRADGSRGGTDREVLRASGRELATALTTQDVPFGAVASQLLREVRPRPRYFPQIYLSMDGPHPLELPGLECSRVRIYHPQAKFEVALILEFTEDAVRGVLQYRTSVLTERTARRLVDAFTDGLRELVKAYDRTG
ncbi:condensation domain-containing protein [Streptomyces sp. NPDC005438]|uniref:condensation domain-containing protein n=1 Tax=Streptomyces sp. NPDC005438 TaxID=3156880 RepID=UPI0033AF38F7